LTAHRKETTGPDTLTGLKESVLKGRRLSGRPLKTVEGFCFIISVRGLTILNTGKSDDDDSMSSVSYAA
jgi:hypothetical protein